MDPYVGEVRMFAGNYAPAGWMKCDGQMLSITQFAILYSLIGTTYGGDGQTTFALPDLRGRIPMHLSATHVLGESSGVESVTLTPSQLPSHSHTPQVDSDLGTTSSPSGINWASSELPNYSTETQNLVPMNAGAVASQGGGQPHDNVMPSLGVTFIISTYGIYPSQN